MCLALSANSFALWSLSRLRVDFQYPSLILILQVPLVWEDFEPSLSHHWALGSAGGVRSLQEASRHVSMLGFQRSSEKSRDMSRVKMKKSFSMLFEFPFTLRVHVHGEAATTGLSLFLCSFCASSFVASFSHPALVCIHGEC